MKYNLLPLLILLGSAAVAQANKAPSVTFVCNYTGERTPCTKTILPSRPATPFVSAAPATPASSINTPELARGVVPKQVTQRYSNGQVKYKGGLLVNLRTGYGIYYYPNGDRYAGQFAYDQPHGKGTYYFADGDKFVGTFRQGKRTGPGVLYDADGEVKEKGDYMNDLLR